VICSEQTAHVINKVKSKNKEVLSSGPILRGPENPTPIERFSTAYLVGETERRTQRRFSKVDQAASSIDSWEVKMSPSDQLIIGVIVGLILCGLFRWTPFLRDLLAALAAAVLIDLLVSDHHGLDLAARATRLPGEILNHPHFYLGVTLAVASVLAALHVFRAR
jgi:hypothetical protein